MPVLAFVWGWIFDRSPLLGLRWSLRSTVIGIVAAIPPFIFFVWTLNSKLPFFTPRRHLLESLLRPIFESWSIVQLAIISILAGISEEVFFRGAIQGSLAGRVGVPVALLLASALLAASHLTTWTYAIIVLFIGAYLGLLWICTGNPLTPMVTHALYDFLALWYFLRVYRPDS
jgi:uncharacterized protein